MFCDLHEDHVGFFKVCLLSTFLVSRVLDWTRTVCILSVLAIWDLRMGGGDIRVLICVNVLPKPRQYR